MKKFITNVEKNRFGDIEKVYYDKEYAPAVVDSLNYNNTFCPAIRNIIVNGPVTKVFFADDTSVMVKCSEKDPQNTEAAIAFCVWKRLYGCVNEKGEVEGNGFSTYLNKILKNKLFDQKKFNEEKNAKKSKDEKKKNPPKNSGKKTVKKSHLPKRDAKGHFIKRG